MTFAKHLKRAGAEVLMRSGALSLARRARVPGAGAVLMYHRVNDAKDPFFPSLPVSVFRRQLDYLQRHYRIVSLPEVVEWVESGAHGVPRVAITIDDGFPDTYAHVFPELAARNLEATLFLTTGPLDGGVPLWTERFRHSMKHATKGVLSLSELGIPAVSLATTDERLAVMKRLLRRFKSLPAGALDSVVARVATELQPRGEPLRTLSWSDVRAMTEGGHVRLGAHTHNHYILARLGDEEVDNEIRTSVELIESRLGIRVDTFCYPNGGADDYDERSLVAVRKLGMRYAVTTRTGFVRRGEPALELPRLYTSERHLSLFAARVAGLGAASGRNGVSS